MRRTLLLGVALVALLVPSIALASDTKVERDDEAVGSVVSAGPGRWVVENLDYTREAEISRSGSRKFKFIHEGETFGYVSRATARRWYVFHENHGKSIGYVEKLGKNEWRAYGNDQSAIGQAFGKASLQGAAAVLLVFDH